MVWLSMVWCGANSVSFFFVDVCYLQARKQNRCLVSDRKPCKRADPPRKRGWEFLPLCQKTSRPVTRPESVTRTHTSRKRRNETLPRGWRKPMGVRTPTATRSGGHDLTTVTSKRMLAVKRKQRSEFTEFTEFRVSRSPLILACMCVANFHSMHADCGQLAKTVIRTHCNYVDCFYSSSVAPCCCGV